VAQPMLCGDRYAALRRVRNARTPQQRSIHVAPSPTQLTFRRVSRAARTHVDNKGWRSKVSGLSRGRAECTLGSLHRIRYLTFLASTAARSDRNESERLHGCIQSHLRARCHCPRLRDSLPPGKCWRSGAPLGALRRRWGAADAYQAHSKPMTKILDRLRLSGGEFEVHAPTPSSRDRQAASLHPSRWSLYRT
jgi:hypothetical protein